MHLSNTLRRGLSFAVLMTVFLFMVSACGGESAPTPTPTPVPAPTPTPTPVPTPTPTPRAAHVERAAFERGGRSWPPCRRQSSAWSTSWSQGPSSLGRRSRAWRRRSRPRTASGWWWTWWPPGFGFVEIEMAAVGDRAYMKLSKDAPWAPLPLAQVPFNFSGLGMTLRDLLSEIEGGAIAGKESLGGRPGHSRRGDHRVRGVGVPHHVRGLGP